MKKIMAMTLAIFMLTAFSACSKKDEKNKAADVKLHSVAVQKLTAEQVKVLLEHDKSLAVIDVRTPQEYSAGHIPNALNADYKSDAFKKWLATADTSAQYIVHCKSGGRSSKAVAMMEGTGFTKIWHLEGGYDAWKALNK